MIGADIHKSLDAGTALSDRIFLEQFAETVEDHDRYALGIFYENQRADGSNSHKEVFVKKMAFEQAGDGFGHDIIGDQDVACSNKDVTHYVRHLFACDYERQHNDAGNYHTYDLEAGIAFLFLVIIVVMVMMVMFVMMVTAASFILVIVVVVMFVIVPAAAFLIVIIMLIMIVVLMKFFVQFFIIGLIVLVHITPPYI
jgi:hypothetical protein